MWQLFIASLFLGWGAAIPLGPINLEIMRRNLTFGARFGVGLGLGACLADLTYVLLLSLGALTLLNHTAVLQVISVVGAAILIWFGIGALRTKNAVVSDIPAGGGKSLLASWLEGFLLTMINPYTVLFWASVSVQLANLTQGGESMRIFIAAIGVVLGTLSWVLGFNAILHITRHRLNARVIRGLNIGGGIILLSFAILSLCKAFHFFSV